MVKLNIFIAVIIILIFILMVTVDIQGFRWMNEWDTGYFAIPTYNGWLFLFRMWGIQLIISCYALLSVVYLIYKFK
jgi:hypothetical protein